VEKMSVDCVSPDTVKIIVYEKSVAGYVEYLGKYMYFDKDGIVVESAEEPTEGIPQVTGLNFDYVVLYEKLPVANDEIFQDILDITQLLTKYEISADKIYFDQDEEMTLYFEDIRVRLGDSSNIDDKIISLKAILPQLEGQKGVLRMENYDESVKSITFNKDE
jgi:cell division protein FtsQ